MHTHEIISTHPDVGGAINPALVACIEACFDCAQACTACADACLSEPDVIELRQCIRLCLDCAGICTATGSVPTDARWSSSKSGSTCERANLHRDGRAGRTHPRPGPAAS